MPPNELSASRVVGTKKIEAKRNGSVGLTVAAQRAVAEEIPVSFLYGGVPYAVMMASPGDAEDFAYGFSLTEGLIDAAQELRALEVRVEGKGLIVDIRLAPDKMSGHLARRRVIAGRTSCGVCGVETADMLPEAAGVAQTEPIAAEAIFAALAHLDANQPLNALTRAVHAAALCARDGSILVAREDVGRHNALDKCIGAALREGREAREGFILVTSRASFEMVEKAAFFGAPLLVAISAPTSLAIDRAQALGLTLAAIARADSLQVFVGALATPRDLAKDPRDAAKKSRDAAKKPCDVVKKPRDVVKESCDLTMDRTGS